MMEGTSPAAIQSESPFQISLPPTATCRSLISSMAIRAFPQKLVLPHSSNRIHPIMKLGRVHRPAALPNISAHKAQQICNVVRLFEPPFPKRIDKGEGHVVRFQQSQADVLTQPSLNSQPCQFTFNFFAHPTLPSREMPT